ncbi:hypothetical protein SLA2020_292850 [Shorea laevis]
MALDPLLSFLSCVAPPDQPESIQPTTSTDASLEETRSDEKTLEKNIHLSPSSDKDLTEMASRCEFVQGLLLSTIFDNDL